MLKGKFRIKYQVRKNKSKYVLYFLTAQNTKIFMGSKHIVKQMFDINYLNGEFEYFGPKEKLP